MNTSLEKAIQSFEEKIEDITIRHEKKLAQARLESLSTMKQANELKSRTKQGSHGSYRIAFR